MPTDTYPTVKAATHYLMGSAPFGSGLRWVRSINGWIEVTGQALTPTGRSAEIKQVGKRYTYSIKEA